MAEKVEIAFEADTSDAQRDIENLGGALGDLSSAAMKENLMDLKKAAGGVFSDIGNAVGDLVDIAAEDELIMMRLDQQITNVGEAAAVSKGDILKLAEDLSKISGFDDEALVEGQTTLLRFGGLTEEQFGKATKAAADLAAQLGMDLPSAFQQVAIALDNPENGLGRLGRRIGSLTEEQQKAIDKLLEMGDTVGAQSLLLEILSGKVDGAAAAYGETFAGKVGKAQLAIDNFKSSVGEEILSPLPQWMVSLGMGAGETGKTLGPVVDSLADLSIVIMTITKGGGLAALGGTLAGLGTAIKAAFAGVAGLIGGISLPVLALIAAIGALIATIVIFGKDAIATLKTISMAFDQFKNMILGNIMVLIALMPKHGAEVGRALVNGIWTGIKTGWSLLTSSLDQLIDGLIEQAKAKLGISSPSKIFAEFGRMIPAGFAEGIRGASPVAAGATSGMVSSMLPSLPAGGGGHGAVINITYAPAVSTASPAEFEANFVPLVDAALRRVNRRR
jgi:hypothetical protein